ncbi:flagellin N-terminal helical domain-containing protein [Paenibacillus spongiae]|uniref:Flagellin n=1 Tax=Paenibacillus spongiae TaxID=2909671 RepID=A0ABY5SAQ7_9BACL|nr:flagellin [Paenibacillus spongiae]UVI29892.1 flagellin [Paenibacillus spongiae]
MRINHNITALNTHRNMGLNNAAAGKSMEKLSSGLRINRAADDAAGLAVSEKMRGQIRGLEQAQKNVQDGVSFVQTAEGAMNEVSAMLSRIKELVVQKANGTYSSSDKGNIDLELTELTDQIDSIMSSTTFNGININTGTINIQADDSTQQITISGIVTTAFVGKASAFKASGTTGALSSIEVAIKAVSTQRATLGAKQNRLEYTSNNLGTTVENLTASESRIRDTDMASQMVKLTKENILLQASQAMLAQANSQPQGVLSLLR